MKAGPPPPPVPDQQIFVRFRGADSARRVVKFDKDDKFVRAWGEKGTNAGPGGKLETRPNYFNNVHGVSVDVMTHEVYVNDRGNHRVQVFDENGKFLDQWDFSRPFANYASMAEDLRLRNSVVVQIQLSIASVALQLACGLGAALLLLGEPMTLPLILSAAVVVGITGVVMAVVGAWVSARMSDAVSNALFAVLLIAVAARMLRQAWKETAKAGG